MHGRKTSNCVSLLLWVIASECFSYICLNFVIFLPPTCKWTDFMEWYSDGLFWAKWVSCSYITWIGRKVSYTSSKTESRSVVRSFTSDCPESGPILEDSSCLAIGMTRQSGHVPSWHLVNGHRWNFLLWIYRSLGARTHKTVCHNCLLLLLVADLFCHRL